MCEAENLHSRKSPEIHVLHEITDFMALWNAHGAKSDLSACSSRHDCKCQGASGKSFENLGPDSPAAFVFRCALAMLGQLPEKSFAAVSIAIAFFPAKHKDGYHQLQLCIALSAVPQSLITFLLGFVRFQHPAS